VEFCRLRIGSALGRNHHVSKEGLLVRPLAIVLVTGIVLTGGLLQSCRKESATGAFIDAAFGPLIPPDAQMLAGLRLEKLRGTQLYQKYESRLNLSMLNDFKARTGLDPQKDIWEMLVAATANDVLIMVRGRFTVGELEPKLDPLGQHRSAYKGYTLIGEEQQAVVFMNPGVAVAGKMASLRSLIDRRDHPGKLAPGLASRLAHIPTEDQLWLVDSGGLPAVGLLTQRDDVQSLLSNLTDYINGASMGIHVDDGLRYEGVLDCTSAEGVKRVRDALRGMVGLARLTTKSDQTDLLRLFDAIVITQSDQAVKIDVRVAPELVTRVVEIFSTMRPQNVRPGGNQ
jgi:hypothetical protein